MHDHLLDSGALQTLNKVLGATGGEQHTHIDSGNLQLAIDANAIIRRGMTPALSEGLFSFQLRNAHTNTSAVETITTEVDPYAVAAGLTGAGYPSPVRQGLDVWLLWVRTNVITAGGFDSGLLSIIYAAVQQGIIAPTGTTAGILGMPVFWSETENTIGDGTLGVILTELGSGLGAKPVGLRIPRGATLRWRTRRGAVAGTHTYDAAGILGLFPAGLGQDALGAG